MKLCLDSSALMKRYFDEPGTVELAGLLEKATQLGLCVLVLPEVLSGLNRRRREGSLSKDSYRRTKKRLLQDVADVTILHLSPAVIAQSVKLLERYSLRTLDALHIACAMEWGADLFATADKRQLQAARQAGLKVKFLG
jgi:uncharacterized protein